MFVRDAEPRRFAVIGLGRFGLELAQLLTGHGHEVLGIDCAEGPVQRAKDVVTHAIQAEVTDVDILNELGLDDVDVAVVAIGDDIEASIFITTLLVEAGVTEVVSRANSRLHGLILDRVGASSVVFPEQDTAWTLAQRLRSPNITAYFILAGETGIARLLAPSVWYGLTTSELRRAKPHPGIILAICRNNEVLSDPGLDIAIQEGDILAVLCPDDHLDDLPHDAGRTGR